MATTTRPRELGEMEQSLNDDNGGSVNRLSKNAQDSSDDTQLPAHSWLTAQKRTELETELSQLGIKKYRLDPATAKLWAQVFCSDDE